MLPTLFCNFGLQQLKLQIWIKVYIFFGTSVFGQLISLIDSKIIISSAKRHNSDRYVKRFKTKDHLISMLFCSFAKCTSLREVSGAMLGLSGKTKHFQLNHIPKKKHTV
jgi:hypothetical protein